jgi:hypothetical protein
MGIGAFEWGCGEKDGKTARLAKGKRHFGFGLSMAREVRDDYCINFQAAMTTSGSAPLARGQESGIRWGI